MNGKNLFTTAELVTIRELLKRLRNVSKTQQKGIRDSLRKIGFYISDYNLPKCTVDDFDALIKSGLIKVVASEIASHITVPSKTIQQKNKSQTQVSNSDTIATILKRLKICNKPDSPALFQLHIYGGIVQLFRESRVYIWSCVPRLSHLSFSNKARAGIFKIKAPMCRSTYYVQIG